MKLLIIPALGFGLLLTDCVDLRSGDGAGGAGSSGGLGSSGSSGKGGSEAPPTVTVDPSVELAQVPPFAYGLHSSVYDNALHHPDVPDLLREAGIGLLRYPGGGYSDNYHWSIHALTQFAEGSPGYLAQRSDFGSYMSLIDAFGGGLMVTVNYGSNLPRSEPIEGTNNVRWVSDGPGEPKEAAAWVAYANGDPGDDRLIGVDGAGNDWHTVGYWATLRSEAPLADDDGLNFLRIVRPAPIAVEYWEIGNEVFGNGYHPRDGIGYELDLHVPYDGTPRAGHELLSGTTYGLSVLDYIAAMKDVDPSIKVGAVLNTPPGDYAWGPNWNDQVLAECGEAIDFAIVHWYPNPGPHYDDPTEEQLETKVPGLLAAPRVTIPRMVDELRASFAEHAPDNAERIELTMTEVGPGFTVPRGRMVPGLDLTQAMSIFAADTYLTLLVHGFTNVDWLELHNGSFLSEATQLKGPAFHGIEIASLLAAPGDRLVSASSTLPELVAHAARRADDRVGLLLLNTEPVGSARLVVEVELTDDAIPLRGQRYDSVPLQHGSHAEVIGPTEFAGISPLAVELDPFSMTLLVFAESE